MTSVLNIEQLRAHGAALEDLDQWDDAIAQLDIAIVDAARARDRLADTAEAMAVAEAQISLTIEGKNEVERKARLVLALDASEGYRALVEQRSGDRLALADAERRIEVTRQRCRLLREAVRLGVCTDE